MRAKKTTIDNLGDIMIKIALFLAFTFVLGATPQVYSMEKESDSESSITEQENSDVNTWNTLLQIKERYDRAFEDLANFKKKLQDKAKDLYSLHIQLSNELAQQQDPTLTVEIASFLGVTARLLKEFPLTCQLNDNALNTSIQTYKNICSMVEFTQKSTPSMNDDALAPLEGIINQAKKDLHELEEVIQRQKNLIGGLEHVLQVGASYFV